MTAKEVVVPLGLDRDELRELAWGYYLQAERHRLDYEAVSQRENALKAKLNAPETPPASNERRLLERLRRYADEEGGYPGEAMLEAAALIERLTPEQERKGASGETSDGYSQEYADKMRAALLRIQGIAGEPHQQGNREVQIQNISCIASDGLLGIERPALKALEQRGEEHGS
jgi:hypothetical protein